MKLFLLKNVISIFSILLFSIVVLGTYVIFVRFNDNNIIDLSELPGPNNKLSSRSQTELHVLLGPPTEIVGGFVSKIKYEKTENPIIWYGGAMAEKEQFEAMIKDYISRQEAGLNLSSNELADSGKASLRNTRAAMMGDIACAPILATSIPRIAPLSINLANVICRAPIPPFDSKANLALVILINTPDGIESSNVEQARKIMLQLQIDIFNRDFLAREIWLHP